MTTKRKHFGKLPPQYKYSLNPYPELRMSKRYEELRVTMGGWFKADQEPPVATPPPSTEWVKE